MKTTISGFRHPFASEQTAASDLPVFVHPTVAAYLAAEYGGVEAAEPGVHYEYCDEAFNDGGALFINLHFDRLVAEVHAVTAGGYKKERFDASGMTIEQIRLLASKTADRLYEKYAD